MEEKNTIHIKSVLESVASEICMHYCKWSDAYKERFDDIDDAAAALQKEMCNNCPLMRLI